MSTSSRLQYWLKLLETVIVREYTGAEKDSMARLWIAERVRDDERMYRAISERKRFETQESVAVSNRMRYFWHPA